MEDWEEESRKKNDCVAEAKLLAKYRGLVFRDPDTNYCAFKVVEQNLESVSYTHLTLPTT